jgi:hypothetical protein
VLNAPLFPFVQIANTKSVDNKSTLLNFLADVVEKRFPDVQDFGEELGNLDRASKGIGKVSQYDDSSFFQFSD